MTGDVTHMGHFSFPLDLKAISLKVVFKRSSSSGKHVMWWSTDREWRCLTAESFSERPWLPYGGEPLEQSRRAEDKFTWVHDRLWRVQMSVQRLMNPAAQCADPGVSVHLLMTKWFECTVQCVVCVCVCVCTVCQQLPLHVHIIMCLKLCVE